MKVILGLFATALGATVWGLAADFRNLTFDEPNLSNLQDIVFSPPPMTFRVGTVADLFPGWSVEVGSERYVGEVFFRTSFRNVPLLTANGFFESDSGYYPAFQPTTGLRFGVSQVATIPFWATELLTLGSGRVYVNDEPFTARGTGNSRELAWDVSKYSGQEIKLELRNYEDGGAIGFFELDILSFNVPEPQDWMLFLVGLCIFGWRSKRLKGPFPRGGE